MSFKIVLEKTEETAEEALAAVERGLENFFIKEIKHVTEDGEVSKTVQELQHIVEQNSQSAIAAPAEEVAAPAQPALGQVAEGASLNPPVEAEQAASAVEESSTTSEVAGETSQDQSAEAEQSATSTEGEEAKPASLPEAAPVGEATV